MTSSLIYSAVLLAAVYGSPTRRLFRQRSPIGIRTSEAVENSSNLHFDYGTGDVVDNVYTYFHNFEVVMKKGAGRPSLRVDHLGNATYLLDQFHAHWGSERAETGSEHSIDDRRTTAELHLVHHSSAFTGLRKAFGHDDGIVVVAVFLEVEDDSSPCSSSDCAQSDLIATLLERKLAGSEFRSLHPRIRPDLWIPETSPFFHYRGSLTTSVHGPVEWIVFERPLRVSKRFMTVLYRLAENNWNPSHKLLEDTQVQRSLYGYGLEDLLTNDEGSGGTEYQPLDEVDLVEIVE